MANSALGFSELALESRKNTNGLAISNCAGMTPRDALEAQEIRITKWQYPVRVE